MLPTKVSMSCDNNPMYADFWPSVSAAWVRITGITPVLAFVGAPAEAPRSEHGEVIVVPPLDGWPMSLQSQWARVWVTQSDPSATWITSDIDMYPLSRRSFIDAVRYISDDGVGVIGVGGNGLNYYNMCYNVARGDVFAEVLRLPRLFSDSLTDVCTVTDPQHAWFRDEHFLCYRLRPLAKTGRVLRVPFLGGRLDRNDWKPDLARARSGGYTDCHSLRPFKANSASIMEVINNVPSYSPASAPVSAEVPEQTLVSEIAPAETTK